MALLAFSSPCLGILFSQVYRSKTCAAAKVFVPMFRDPFFTVSQMKDKELMNLVFVLMFGDPFFTSNDKEYANVNVEFSSPCLGILFSLSNSL